VKYRGNTLIYAVILINIAVIIAYIIFSKSSILIQNANLQAYNAKLNKNIQEKTELTMRYDMFLANQYGGKYAEIPGCPSSVTLSGTTNLGIIVATQPYLTGSNMFCSGSIGTNLLNLQYYFYFPFSSFFSKSKKKNITPSIPLDEGGQKIFLVNFKNFFNGKSFSRE